MTSPPAWCATTTSRSSPSRARTTTPTTQHIMSALDHKPHITMDDGADLVTIALTKRTDVLDGIIGGTEETTTGVIRLRAMAKEGVLTLSDHRRQRRRHQAPVRQPLRHRPIHHRRHHPRHQLPAGRIEVRGRRLRLVRTRAGQPRARPGRRGHRHRNRSDQGDRSGDGRLPRDDHGRSRQDRRRLLHRHRQQERAAQGALRS